MLFWILGIVSTLGIAGTVAACVLAPAIAIPIVQSVASALIRCKPCLVALALIAAASGGALYGAHVERAKCQAADLAAELRNREIDLENASKARSDETERANKIEGDSSDQHNQDLALIADLKKRSATCIFDAHDAGLPDDKPGPGNAEPATGTAKAGAGIASPVPHKRLLLPVVRDSWMPWRGRKSNAPPHQ